MKPHTDRVTGLVMSSDHNLIVTMSADEMIFFFKVHSSYTVLIYFPNNIKIISYLELCFEVSG